MILKTKMDTRGPYAPTPGQYTYLHNIQTSPLKPLGQSKPKFYVKHLKDGVTNVFINNPGHMTKMAAMPIYGKNPSKSSSPEPVD